MTDISAPILNGIDNRELSLLRHAFRLAHYNSKIKTVPRFKLLAENNTRGGFLSGSKAAMLVEGSPVWFRALVEIGKTFGWRKNELLTLRVRHVDLFARQIRLDPGSTKNKDLRMVPMTAAIHVLLAACVEGKSGEDHVFTRDNEDRTAVVDFRDLWASQCCAAKLGHTVCPACFQRARAREGKAADQLASRYAVDENRHCPRCSKKWTRDEVRYVGLIFHDLRRTAARSMRNSGLAEDICMRLGGWKTPKVFRRYSIATESDLENAVARIEAVEKENRYINRYSDAPAASGEAGPGQSTKTHNLN